MHGFLLLSFFFFPFSLSVKSVPICHVPVCHILQCCTMEALGSLKKIPCLEYSMNCTALWSTTHSVRLARIPYVLPICSMVAHTVSLSRGVAPQTGTENFDNTEVAWLDFSCHIIWKMLDSIPYISPPQWPLNTIQLYILSWIFSLLLEILFSW